MSLSPHAEKAAKHVRYEITMLEAAADRLLQANWAKDQVLTNLLLEAFLIHVRSLHEFFFRRAKAKFPLDIRAHQYFDRDDEWMESSEKRCPVLHPHLDRLDKSIPHISAARISYDGAAKDWPVTEIARELSKVCEEFFRRLPRDRREWFAAESGQEPPRLSVAPVQFSARTCAVTNVRTEISNSAFRGTAIGEESKRGRS